VLRLLLPATVVIVSSMGIGRHAHRFRPWLATWTLALLSAATVTASAGALSAVIVAQLASVPWLAARVGWCVKMAGGPLPLVSVMAAVLAAASAAFNLTRAARRQRSETRRFGADPIVVVPSASVAALAVPGRFGQPGQIVVTTGMLGALDPDERRAMFAHELAHLDLRHHLFLRVSGLAAAVLPLLRPLHLGVGLATERWADERAARDVGSRSLVARAVAKGALAAAGEPLPPGVMALTGGPTETRVRALLEDHRSAASNEAAFTSAAIVTVGLAATQVHHLVTLVLHAC